MVGVMRWTISEDGRVLSRELARLHRSASYGSEYAYVPVSQEGTPFYVKYLLIIIKSFNVAVATAPGVFEHKDREFRIPPSPLFGRRVADYQDGRGNIAIAFYVDLSSCLMVSTNR
jgi:hypothetical protein